MWVSSVKKIAILVVIFCISACTSLQTNDKHQEKLYRAAKINTQLGMAYLQRHEIQRAKQKFLLALDQNPKLPEAWYSMGYFMETTGDLDNAKTYYQKALALAPEKGDVQNNYGTFLCRRGEYAESIKHFMLAIEDREYLDTASAYENAGLCALKVPDKKLALKYFNRAIMEDPNRPSALMEAANLNFENKNFQDAKLQLAEYLAIAAPTQQSLLLSRQLGQIDVPFPRVIS